MVGLLLTGDVEVASFLQKEVQVFEVFWNEEARVPHEVQDVPEHCAISVYEVVLFQ